MNALCFFPFVIKFLDSRRIVTYFHSRTLLKKDVGFDIDVIVKLGIDVGVDVNINVDVDFNVDINVNIYVSVDAAVDVNVEGIFFNIK